MTSMQKDPTVADVRTARHVHVPGPGDVFTRDNRSAVMTVAKQMAASHARSGAEAIMVAGAGLVDPDWDGPSVVEGTRTRTPSSKAARLADLALGRVLGGRPLTAAAFRKVPSAVDDVVFVHAHPAGLLVPRPGLGVLYLHNDSLARLARREVRAVGRAADAVVSVSADLASRFPDLACPVVVVPNGADTAQFHPSERRGAAGGRLRISFVGRVVPDKGVHVLVAAVDALRDLDLELDVVGSGGQPRLSAYEQQLRRDAAGLGERVRFTRDMPRRELGAYLRTRDVLVVPSVWQEPSGLVVAEGVASGLAVVASRVGGIPEVAGDACVYVEPGSVEALVEALRPLATDPGALIAAQDGARAADVSWDRAHERLVGELERVLR